MKQRKKLLAGLLALTLAVGLSPQVGAQSDLQGHWAQGAIESLCQRGLMGGYADGSFLPDAPVRRGELAKLISLATDSLPYRPVLQEAGSFADLQGHWARNYVRQLVLEGIVQTADYGGNFGPQEGASRLEMLRMTMRMLGFSYGGQTVVARFPDLQSLSAADQYYCNKAVEIGLVEGFADGTLRPQASISRGEAAVILQRALPKTQIVVENLAAYEEDNTIPRAEQFFDVVEGSLHTGQGQYQGNTMQVYQHQLAGKQASQWESGLSRYLEVLESQRYTLVAQEKKGEESSYLLADLRGSRCLLLSLGQKDGATGQPTLGVGLFQNKNATGEYGSYIDALGVATLCKALNLAPATFGPEKDEKGGQSPTETYRLSLLPAGAVQGFIDRLLQQGYQQDAAGQPGGQTRVFTREGKRVTLSQSDGLLRIQLQQKS